MGARFILPRFVPNPHKSGCRCGNKWDATGFFRTDKQRWCRCSCRYCHVHGLAVRRREANELHKHFPDGESYTLATLKFSLYLTGVGITKALSVFKRQARKHYPDLEAVAFLHFKAGVPDLHVIIKTPRPCEREIIKKCATVAFSVAGEPSPRSRRVSVKPADHVHGFSQLLFAHRQAGNEAERATAGELYLPVGLQNQRLEESIQPSRSGHYNSSTTNGAAG
jgi:hypothetical protein